MACENEMNLFCFTIILIHVGIDGISSATSLRDTNQNTTANVTEDLRLFDNTKCNFFFNLDYFVDLIFFLSSL